MSVARCKGFAYDTADATATLSSRFIKIQNGLKFLMPSYPGCHGKEAIKHASVNLLTAIFNKTYILTYYIEELKKFRKRVT